MAKPHRTYRPLHAVFLNRWADLSGNPYRTDREERERKELEAVLLREGKHPAPACKRKKRESGDAS